MLELYFIIALLAIGIILDLVRGDRLETLVAKVLQGTAKLQITEDRQMADLDEILDKVRAQKTLLEGVKVFIDDLKAHQGDPAKLAEIVAELDANNLTLDLLDNVEPPTP